MDIDKYGPEGYRIAYEDKAKWRQHLQEHGFVVIKNYIPKDQCEKYVN